MPFTDEAVTELEQKRVLACSLPETPTMELNGTWLWLLFSSGNKPSEDSRTKLKAAGFWFSGKHQKWIYNGKRKKYNKASGRSYQQIKDTFGSQTLSQSRGRDGDDN